MAGGHRQNVQFETAPAMERPTDFRHAGPADRATMKNSQNVLGSFLRAVFLLTSLMIAIIIIGEVYLSVVNIDGLAGRQSRILNTYQAKQEIQHLLVAADDMLLATRHYLLLADETYELKFNSAVNQLRLSLDHLRRLTAESPSQQRRLDQIEQLFPALRGNFERLGQVFRQSGYNGVAMLLERGEDIRRQDQLDELVRQLDNEQGGLLLANIAADARQERQAWVLVVLGSALSVLVGLGAFLLLHRDLAKRRRIEAQLAEKTGLLQTTFDNIGQGLAVFDRHLRLVAWNRQFVEIFSLPAALTVVGRGYADFLRHLAGRGYFGTADVEEHIEQLVAGMRTAANVTVTGKTDGRSVEITRQRMPDGGTISTYSDVTDRKKVERTKDEFVSTVSHELRTPLTSIQGALGLIVGGALGPTPPEMKAMIDIAHSNSERLVRLINDILDIEKIRIWWPGIPPSAPAAIADPAKVDRSERGLCRKIQCQDTLRGRRARRAGRHRCGPPDAGHGQPPLQRGEILDAGGYGRGHAGAPGKDAPDLDRRPRARHPG